MNEKMIDAGRHDVAEFMSMYPGACPVIKNGELVPDYSQPAPKDRIELDSIARNIYQRQEAVEIVEQITVSLAI